MNYTQFYLYLQYFHGYSCKSLTAIIMPCLISNHKQWQKLQIMEIKSVLAKNSQIPSYSLRQQLKWTHKNILYNIFPNRRIFLKSIWNLQLGSKVRVVFLLDFYVFMHSIRVSIRLIRSFIRIIKIYSE